MAQLDNRGYEYYIPQDVGGLCINSIDTNDKKIQELEIRIECLENKLKKEQKQESKYITVLGGFDEEI